MELLRLSALFALTALAEITGCYLPWLVLKQGKSAVLLLPAAAALALFAWPLTLHPAAAGRTYAAYGGMYIAVALIWLRVVDGVARGWNCTHPGFSSVARRTPNGDTARDGAVGRSSDAFSGSHHRANGSIASGSVEIPAPKSFDKGLLLAPVALAVIALTGYFGFR